MASLYNIGTRLQFWGHVRKSNGCWEWDGAKRDGYGLASIKKGKSRSQNAHRVSWEMKFGEIPNGMLVLHRCDNRCCVRPDHLFLGTMNDNMKDRNDKGRQAKGERCGRATITEEQARRILSLKSLGRAPWGYARDIAQQFGIQDRQVVLHIWSRRTWRHL